METRSRKRAEASSSAQSPSSSSRPSKRSRTSAAAVPSVNTRLRSSNSAAADNSNSSISNNPNPTMDPSSASAPDSSSTRSRRSRNSNNGSHQEPSDKGKEREPPESTSRAREREREREREAERLFGLSFDNGGAGDDDDSESGVGILHQNLTSASSALQGLLRKLGAGLDDLLPSSTASGSSSSHQSSRLKKILAGLRADGEEGKQVEALTQLCEMLSIGTEESLGSFSVDSFVPVLVGLLNHESNADIMLLAARALTHLCDVLPSSCAAVVHYGAVPCFCARLLTIEYMDLAEQVRLVNSVVYCY